MKFVIHTTVNHVILNISQNSCLFTVNILWQKSSTALLVVFHCNCDQETANHKYIPGLLAIGGEEKMCSILLWQPSDLVDFFFNLKTLQVVKIWFVALERAVDIVLPRVPSLPCLLWFPFRLSRTNMKEKTALNEHIYSMCKDSIHSIHSKTRVGSRWSDYYKFYIMNWPQSLSGRWPLGHLYPLWPGGPLSG